MKFHDRFKLHVLIDDDAGGASTVVIAFIANVLVAIAKTVAAVLTGSSSVRTEAVHAGEHTQAELATILRDLEGRMMQRKFVGLAIMSLAATEDTDLAV